MENIDICQLAIKHTIEEATGDYLEIIADKRELAITCIENMHKIRMFLDRRPKFFDIIEREKDQVRIEYHHEAPKEVVKRCDKHSSLSKFFTKTSNLKFLFKSK